MAARAHHTGGGSMSHDPKAWSGIEPYEVPLGQVWWRAGQKWVAVCRQNDWRN